jgi:hypothetical protein
VVRRIHKWRLDVETIERAEENPPIKISKGIVKVDGVKLRDLAEKFGWAFTSENVVVVGPIGWMGQMAGLPPETYHVYIFMNPDDAHAYGEGVRDGSREMLLFQLPRYLFTGGSAGPIHEIWTRDRGRAAKGMIAVARVFNYEDEIYVDMMTVRPSAKRNRVNAALIATVVEAFDKGRNKKLTFSKATPEGQKFLDWLQEQRE